MKYKKENINIQDSFKRKFFCILNKKEQSDVLSEAMYQQQFYIAVPIQTLIECSINKKIKQKIHHIEFINIKEDVENHKQIILDLYFKRV